MHLSSSNILSSGRMVSSWLLSPASVEESRLREDRVEEASLGCSSVLEDPIVADVANPGEKSPSGERTVGVLEGRKFDREDFRRRVCAIKKEEIGRAHV